MLKRPQFVLVASAIVVAIVSSGLYVIIKRVHRDGSALHGADSHPSPHPAKIDSADSDSLLRDCAQQSAAHVAGGRGPQAMETIARTAALIDARIADVQRQAKLAADDPVVPALALYEMEPDEAPSSSQLVDRGPNGIHGDVESADLYVQGHTGHAIALDGSKWSTQVPPNRLGIFNKVRREISITAWVRPDNIDSLMPIVGKRPWFAGPEPFALAIDREGKVLFTGFHGGGWYQFWSSKLPLKPGQWTHVAASFAVGDGVVLYVNGAEAGRFDAREVPSELVPNNQPLCIGSDWRWDMKQQTMMRHCFAGAIDSVHLFAAALTPSQIAQDMNGHLGSKAFKEDTRRHLAQQQASLAIDRCVIDLLAADAALDLGTSTRDTWLAQCRDALDRLVDRSADAIERLAAACPEPSRAACLRRVVQADLPTGARAAAAAILAANHAPALDAKAEEVQQFFDDLIAATIDAPAVCEALLIRYIDALDRRGETDAAGGVLDGLLAAIPDSSIAARAALLRVDGEPSTVRDALALQMLSSYAGTASAHALRVRSAHALARQRRFLDGVISLDGANALAAWKDKRDLVRIMVESIRGFTTDPSLIHQRSLPEAQIATDPQPPSAPPAPLDVLLGAAVELIGADFGIEAFRLSAGDAQALPTALGSAIEQPVLRRLLQRALVGAPPDRLRGTLLARAEGARAASTSTPDGEGVARRFYQLMLRARILSSSRRGDEAIATYEQILAGFPHDAPMARQARGRLLEVLLDAQPIDADAIARHISALDGPQEPISAWNYRTRLLCRRTLNSAPDDRASVWRQGLGGLQADRPRLLPRTLSDIDALLKAIAGQPGLAPLDVLTDLVLLVPDLPALHQLQERRLAAFEAAKDYPSALAASGFHLALCSISDAGPDGALQRKATLMAHAGLAPAKALEFRNAFLLPSGSNAAGSEPFDPRPGVDPLLTQGAQALLPHHTGPSRRHAYLLLLAGRPDDAVREAHQCLFSSNPAPAEVSTAFADLSVMLLLAGKPLNEATVHARTLAGPIAPGEQVVPLSLAMEVPSAAALPPPATRPASFATLDAERRAELARIFVRDWGQRLLLSGLPLATADRAADGNVLCAIAINAQARSADANSLVELLLERTLRRSSDLDQARRATATIESLLPMLNPPAAAYVRDRLTAIRRGADLEFAKLLFEEGKFGECLEALDQLDRLLPERPGAEDISTGFMRVMCLIRLERSDAAIDFLKRMENWPGTDEQHAKCVFLLAWIHVQREAPREALPLLKQVIEKYPDTAFVEKARRLAETIE